jgi:hypothetical protein
MKKIIQILILTLALTSTYAQESKTYKINRSEFYIYNEVTKEWEQQSVNDDVNINLVTYRNVINIQAKIPSLYRLDEDSKEKIETNSLQGYQYKAIECVDMKKCVVDILVSKKEENRVFVFSAVFDNQVLGKVNLRFFGYVE